MENIFVVPAESLPKFQGFMKANESVINTIRQNGFFVERTKAENNSTIKQIIPYMTFVRNEKIFVMRRLEKGGEARLHNKHSIGIGGHINHEDAKPLEDGLRREFFEEVNYMGKFKPRLLGFINDDSDDVGKVHFGLSYVVEGDLGIEVKEKDVLEGRMMHHDEIDANSLEKWSRIVMKNLPPLSFK